MHMIYLIFDSEVYGLNFIVTKMPENKLLLYGEVKDINSPATSLTFSNKLKGTDGHHIGSTESYIDAISWILNTLTSKEHGVIKHRSDISVIGHRVVHGGIQFTKPTQLDEQIVSEIAHYNEFAPFHNPFNIKNINAVLEELPGIPQYAIFDTAFHQTMPPKAYTYAINYSLAKRYGLRRFGFHGISHKHMAEETAQHLKTPLEKLNLITLQLGHGCSICAIQNGNSIDTSMGLTPTEGLIMERRSGDIDPLLMLYLLNHEKWTYEDMMMQINKMSGIYGMSGKLVGIKQLLSEINDGNEEAQIALDTFIYRIQKYIGSYIAALGSVHAIVCTGIHAKYYPVVREMIFNNLPAFNIKLDPQRNNKYIKDVSGKISSDDSAIPVFYIRQATKRAIAKEIYNYLQNKT